MVYLSGPIFVCSDEECNRWRSEARLLLQDDVLDPMTRDYRGKTDENVTAIVLADIQDILRCRFMLTNANRPSWGTAMEIVYAYNNGVHVVSFNSGGPISPWLLYHSKHCCSSIEEACRYINNQ